MIDLHCHILPGIDDGSKNLAESLKILRHAAEAGVTTAILTPHYVRDSKYNCNNARKNQLLEILKIAVQDAEIPIDLHLGNEVYLDQNLLDLLSSGEIATLANSRYLLIELPVLTEDQTARDTLFKLITSGFTPIIAHPERYAYVQKDPHYLDAFIELGCLFQGDYQSLLGKYGRAAKKSLAQLIKAGTITFLASDTHHSSDDYNLRKAIRRTCGLVKTAREAEALFETNPRKVLENATISPKA